MKSTKAVDYIEFVRIILCFEQTIIVPVVNCSPIATWNNVMIFMAYCYHYIDVIMGTIESQISSFTIVYSTVYSDPDQKKHQSFASLAFVRGIHRDLGIPPTNDQ